MSYERDEELREKARQLDAIRLLQGKIAGNNDVVRALSRETDSFELALKMLLEAYETPLVHKE